MAVASVVTEDLASLALITPEMKVAALNREKAQNFIKTYHAPYYRDLGDGEVKDYTAHGALPDGVS